MVINGVYNLIDTIFIGQTIGTMGIAGLAVYIPIMSLIMAICGLVGMGAGSYFSRAFGKKNFEEVNQTTGMTITLSLTFGILFGVFGYFFTEPILKMFGTTDTILPYALPYAKTMFIGTIYFPLVVSMNNLLRAEGNAKDAMIAMIIGTVANIFLDWLFVVHFSMGLSGAAMATNIGKGISVLFMIWYFFLSGRTIVKLKWKHLLIKIHILKDIVSVGMSSFAMNMAGAVTVSLTNFLLGSLSGDVAIASYGLIFRILMLEIMVLVGFVHGLQPMIGYNYGANKLDRVHKAIKYTIRWTLTIGLIFMGLCEIFPSIVIKTFSSDPILIESTIIPLRIIMSTTFLIGMQMTFTTFFQSIGYAKIAFVLSIMRQVLLYIPLLLLLPIVFKLGVNGIWISFPISDSITVLVSYLVFKKQSKIIFHLKTYKKT
jgi:putative MATE family efflux protein